MADTRAVTSAADRPPSSATTMVKARKTKARFEAGVRVRRGMSTTATIIDPRPPVTIQIRPSSCLLIADPPFHRSVALVHDRGHRGSQRRGCQAGDDIEWRGWLPREGGETAPGHSGGETPRP